MFDERSKMEIVEPEMAPKSSFDEGRFEVVGNGEDRGMNFTVQDNEMPKVIYHLPVTQLVARRLQMYPEGLSVIRLDKYQAALVLYPYGPGDSRNLFLYTFDLIEPENLKSEPTGNVEVVVQPKEVREDWGLDLLPQRPDEESGAYMERVTRSFVAARYVGDFRKAFEKINVSLRILPWQEQLALSDAWLELDREKFIAFAKRFGADGVRALITLDYGRHLSDVIYDIADKLPEEQAREIFTAFAELKNQSFTTGRIIGKSVLSQEMELPQELRKTFNYEVQEAILRRGKDMLFAAQGLAGGRETRATAFQGRELVIEDAAEVAKAMDIYSTALDKLNSLMKPENSKNNFRFVLREARLEQLPQIFEFTVEDLNSGKISYMTIQLRERGAALGEHNQQLEFDGEARVNFIFSTEEIGQDITSLSRRQALSLRLDREGKVREGGKIISNDPTVQKGEISLEIGGFPKEGEDNSDSATVGRIISIGNALATAKESPNEKKYAQYYHNRESFARELGNADNFAAIVKFVREKITQYYAKDRPERQAANF